MKLLKYFFLTIVSLLFIWTVYANLEAKPMHAYAPSASLMVLDVPSYLSPLDSISITQELSTQDGISAIVFNSDIKRLSIMYHENITNKKNIMNILHQTDHTFVNPDFGSTDPNLPQCPIPAEWFTKLEKWKYAFCFR